MEQAANAKLQSMAEERERANESHLQLLQSEIERYYQLEI